MKSIEFILLDIFDNQKLVDAIFSSPRKELSGETKKITVRTLFLKNKHVYQVSKFVGQKALHENISLEQAKVLIQECLKQFKQGVIRTPSCDYHLLVNKKGMVTVLSKPPTKTNSLPAHNRQKQYVLEEGIPIPYLIALGIMSSSGQILAKKRDKFRQINRFLEFIEDIVPLLKTTQGRPLRIVDFGCGKASLTFALYDHLCRRHGLQIEILGLDLKGDVIESCQALSDQLDYQGLRFQQGRIEDLAVQEDVDLVVALHACDTATDAAIAKAVQWHAKVILAVPCCQHELFKQIKNESLGPLLHQGILKERFAALATDAARGQILEIAGYRTQVMEFIDLEHTPKNLLIRAVLQREKGRQAQALKEYQTFKQTLGITPTLELLLKVNAPDPIS